MRIGAIAAACLLASTVVAIAAPARAAAPAWTLRDPATGENVALVPDAPATHVVFFATWCPPCRAELGPLGELDARWGDRGYRLVVVAVANRQSVERLAEFAAGHDVPGRLLFDADGTLQAALGVEELPAHVVFDSAGDVVGRSGSLDDGVRTAIEKLLAGRRPGGRAP